MNNVQTFEELGEIFDFLSKFLIFKGVSPRNDGQNPKKYQYSQFLR
jgi:hypothetical protein